MELLLYLFKFSILQFVLCLCHVFAPFTSHIAFFGIEKFFLLLCSPSVNYTFFLHYFGDYPRGYNMHPWFDLVNLKLRLLLLAENSRTLQHCNWIYRPVFSATLEGYFNSLCILNPIRHYHYCFKLSILI